MAPLFLIPLLLVDDSVDDSVDGAFPDINAPPSIPPSLLDGFLTLSRDRLSGPSRAIFVIVFDGTIPAQFHVCTIEPVARADQFSQDCNRIWHGYSVGHTIPVVMTRMSPTAFTGIMVVPLPWVIVNSICERCGSIDHVTCQ